MAYKPVFYSPVIAPPPTASAGGASGPAPSEPVPFTDPDTDYAALTAAHAVTVGGSGAGALKITLSGNAKPIVLSLAGGQASYIPKGKDYLLADGSRLRLQDAAIRAGRGTLVLQLWAEDIGLMEINAGKALRPFHFAAYHNVGPLEVEAAFTGLVAAAKDLEINLGSGLPATATRAAKNAAFLARFMLGEVSLLVRGGTVVGSAGPALPPVAGSAETTLAVFDQVGCPDSAAPFLRALPALGGVQWQAHPLIAALPAAAGAMNDPTDLTLAKVGSATFSGSITWDGKVYAVRGSVCYPAQSDGPGAPFDTARAPAPIVFIVHGNHAMVRNPANPDPDAESIFIAPFKPLLAAPSSVGIKYVKIAAGWVPDGWVVEAPSHSGWIPAGYVELPGRPDRYGPAGWKEIPNHEGYPYLQHQLARMGIIAASLDCNETNGVIALGETNITLRTMLLHAAVQHFQSLAMSSGAFDSMIDFSRVGLVGHSRGGEAVVNLAEKASIPFLFALPGVSIKGLLALAPSNVPAMHHRVNGYALLVVLLAGDGDVVENSGAVFYDRADAKPFKCQLYAHFTNHNYFNREWLKDESRGPAVLSRGEHERLLLAYGSAFFRKVLLGEDTIGFLDGDITPSGTSACRVYSSFTSAVPASASGRRVALVDDYEHPPPASGGRLNAVGGSTTTQAMTETVQLCQEVAARVFPSSTFFGDTTAMILATTLVDGIYRSELPSSLSDLTGREISLRAGEVYRAPFVPTSSSGFKVGVEDAQGVRSWVDTDAIGGLARIYDRQYDDYLQGIADYTKTMPQTLRVPAAAFVAEKPTIRIDNAKAILLQFDRRDARSFVIDDLEVIDPQGTVP